MLVLGLCRVLCHTLVDESEGQGQPIEYQCHKHNPRWVRLEFVDLSLGFLGNGKLATVYLAAWSQMCKQKSVLLVQFCLLE